MHEYVNEFIQSMNEHANAKYRAATGNRGSQSRGFVVEAERVTNRDVPDTGLLRVWQRPMSDPRSEKWGKAWEFSGSWEEVLSEFESLDSKAAVMQKLE